MGLDVIVDLLTEFITDTGCHGIKSFDISLFSMYSTTENVLAIIDSETGAGNGNNVLEITGSSHVMHVFMNMSYI